MMLFDNDKVMLPNMPEGLILNLLLNYLSVIDNKIKATDYCQ
ncbi:hypothetical protein HMPREF1502_1088 [Klebsiella sp. AS10]|mgnify:CR=1 FL=1|nr:hypothetical protein HMPREF1502_1088 [Klebsiella sp. AS10]